jgi:hypothetical protein
MSTRQVLARMFAAPEVPERIVSVRRQTLYCALCYVMSVDNLDMPMPDDDEAVTIIDGNAACQDHLYLLAGRTVAEALEVLKAEDRP